MQGPHWEVEPGPGREGPVDSSSGGAYLALPCPPARPTLGPPSPTPLGLREALESWAGWRETLWRQDPHNETVHETVAEAMGA